MKFYKLIITFILLIAVFNFSTAQNKINRQSLLWGRYYLKLRLNDKYTIRHEVEERVFFKNQRQHQFLTRAFVDRNLGKGWNTAIGLAYFLQAIPQDPNIENYSNRGEIRPILEFGKRHILPHNFEIDHRLWNEFRFFEQSNGSHNYRNIRFRYRLELRYQALDILALRVLNELHFNSNNNSNKAFFDQNRVSIGAQYFPKPYLGFELAYIKWYQQISLEKDFYDRDILRLTVFMNFNI